MIETIVFDEQIHEGDLVTSSCGIEHSVRQGKPSIHLFEISENTGVLIGDNLFQGCEEIRDRLYPDVKLQDIEWRLTAGIYDTKISFKEEGNYVTAIEIEKSFHSGGHFKNTVEQYQESLDAPEGFEHSQSGGRSFLGGGAVTIFPVLVPEHPDGYVLFKSSKGYQDPDLPKTIVLADSQKILALWKAQTEDLSHILNRFNTSAEDIRKAPWASGYDSVLLSSPLEDSLKHMDGQSASSMYDLPEISYDVRDGRIGFTNGRHRLFNAINAGAAFVPVEMYDSEQTKLFQEQCGWKTYATPLTPRRVHAHIPRWE